MSSKVTFKIATVAVALSAALFGSTAFAQSHGGHGGGMGHGGGAHAVSSYHAPNFARGVAHGYVHGGVRPYYGGYGHVGYGSRFYGSRPYFYRSGFYPRHRIYGGLALGLFFASLPLYYDTIWWGGVPYYYNDGTYYLYNDRVRKYEVVAPPYSDDARADAAPASADLFVYPKDGQSEDQQRTDRFECHQWAANQSGFDPSNGAAAAPEKLSDYRRAETACLTGRGYSVK